MTNTPDEPERCDHTPTLIAGGAMRCTKCMEIVADTEDSRAERPKVVCLCGSTRFYEAFQEANFRLTLEGFIVLSVGFYPHAADRAHAAHIGITPKQKEALDELHFRKIDLADRVHFLNIGGYIGASTARELAYAIANNKETTFTDGGLGNVFAEANAHELGKMVASFAALKETPPLPENLRQVKV